MPLSKLVSTKPFYQLRLQVYTAFNVSTTVGWPAVCHQFISSRFHPPAPPSSSESITKHQLVGYIKSHGSTTPPCYSAIPGCHHETQVKLCLKNNSHRIIPEHSPKKTKSWLSQNEYSNPPPSMKGKNKNTKANVSHVLPLAHLFFSHVLHWSKASVPTIVNLQQIFPKLQP